MKFVPVAVFSVVEFIRYLGRKSQKIMEASFKREISKARYPCQPGDGKEGSIFI